jgi:hypothetical protein
MTTIAHPELSRVTVGVDTHGDIHVACALDQLGRHLATTVRDERPVVLGITATHVGAVIAP